MKRSSTIKNYPARTSGSHFWLLAVLLPLAWLAPQVMQAQVSGYSFSQSAGTYTPITGTVIGQATDPLPTASPETATMDDNTYASTTIPFTFMYNGAPYTSVQICTNGWVALGTTTHSGSLPLSTGDAFSGAIAPFAMDLMGIYSATVDRTNGSNVLTNVSNTSTCTIGAPIQGTGIPAGTTITAFTANSITLSANATATATGAFASWTTGQISTTTLGTSPNRIFVVQFKGMSQYSNSTTNNNTSCEFQVRLKETSNQIEVIYGNVWRLAGSATPQVGIRGSTNADYNNRTGTTNWTTTTAGGANTATITWSSTVAPASGLTFTWTPPPPCVVPTSLAASVTATAPSPSVISGSFTAAPIAPTGYVVVRTTTNTPPAIVNGTTYTVGTNAIGYIEYAGTAAGSWTSAGLTASTTYYYWVFSYNNTACSGGPVYSATAATATAATLDCTFPPGTYTVGATGNLPSLTVAIGYLTACPQTGAYVFELLSDYNPASETYPITFPNLAGSSATNTVTVRPAAGSTAAITSNNATATLRLDGMDYLILDGRPGGTGTPKTLVVENTNTAGVAIQFINDATNNLIQYTTVKGVNSTTSGGVILFGTTTGTTGNDNNSIDNCDIRDGATTPNFGIFSLGSTASTAVNNSNNTISNSNIYNFFSATNSSNGISLSSGNTDWTISGNHIYQTATRTATAGSTHTGINISNTTSGNNFVVTGNFIGGSAINAGGTPWTVGGTVANRFVGININVGTTTPSSIQNNIVANFAWSTSSGATSLPAVWIGIYVSSGSANVGTVTGNTVGSGTGTGSITVTSGTTGAVSAGIGSGSGAAVAISNNTVGSVTVTGSSATISHAFNGIWNGGTPTTLTINNNLVGSLATANSINASNASTSTSAQFINGILSTGGTAVSITNNTVANLNSAYVPAAANTSNTLRGIATTGGSNTVSGNTVRNLSTAANATGTAGSSSVIGIAQTSTTAGQTISQNTVYALGNAHASAAVSVIGIHMSGPSSGTNLVHRNLVYSLSVSSSSATAEIRGINVSGGAATYQNNMIRLGLDASGASLANGLVVNGIYDVSGTNNYYHNTVYVGGTGAAGTAATHAFRSDVTTNTRAFLNNIFVNARSNGAGTGKHYAIRLAGTAANPAGLTSNGNLYHATGTGGVFGFFNAADVANLAAWQTAVGKDANSIYADPCLAAPAAATPDLHLTNCAGAGSPANATGVTGTGVTVDFDGETRSGLTPIDIGADAGNYGPSGLDLASTALVTPTATGCKTNAETVTVTITNNSSSNIDFSVNNATVTVTTAGGYNSSMILNTGTLASGATQDVTMPATLDMSANGTYVFTVTTAVTGDLNATNDVLTPVNRTVLALGGTYTVGAGGNYTTLTAAVADYNNANCFTAPVVFSLTDANYSTGETFPITVNANAFAGAAFPLTIRPAAGATPLITGSSTSAIIKLNGADYITIDGSNSGSNTRDLTISNTATTGTTAVVWVGSLGTAAGATNNTIKNTNVLNGINTVTTFYGIFAGSATGIGTAGDDNDGLTLSNNSVAKTYYGIYAAATSAGVNNGLVVSGNSIGSATAGNELSFSGIYVAQATGALIEGNDVFGITQSTSFDAVNINTGVANSLVSKNRIHHLTNNGTNRCAAISLNASAGANVTVANNVIYALANNGTGVTTTFGTYGIYVNGGDTYKIYYNSINLTGDRDAVATTKPTTVSACILVNTGTALDIRNNILVNSQTAATNSPKSYTIYSTVANTAFAAIDYNDYFVSGAQGVLGFIGSDRTTLAAMQTGFGSNANSLNVAPVFNSPTDLHLTLASNTGLVDKGTVIAAVTTDIDNDARGTSPDVGADEFGNRPAAPTSLTQSVITPSCTGGSVLYALPAAPANVTYYLQANATDTLVANPLVGDSITVFTNGTYYVRAKDAVTGLWSSATASVTVTNIPVAPLPPSPVPAQTPACLSTTISVPAPGSPNVTYYWQGTTNGGTSTAQNASTPLTVTASGTYYVAAFDASSNCWSNTNGAAVVIDTQIPVAPVVTPASQSICVGGSQVLNASSAGPLVPIFSENFEGTVNMTTVNTSTGTNPANAAWTVRNDGYQNTGGTTVFTFHSPNNSKFILSNSDAVGSGSNVVTQLISPVINTTGYAGLSLKFDHHFKARLASNAKVDVSINGGTSWTTIQTYTSTDAGAPDAFASATLNLNTYVNNPNFRIRFVYTAGWDWFWALDNIVLSGNSPLPTAWTAIPTGAGLPAGAETYGANSPITVTPTGTGTYTYVATVQNSPGVCTSTGDTAIITVNPLPTVDAGAAQTVCPGDTVTLSGSGATSYTWNNGVTNNTEFVATTTTLYTVTGTDANGCSAQDTVSVIVKPASPATITPSGPLTFCQNESLTLTAGGPANGPATVITQWNFNAGNLTPSTGTGTATLIGGTTSAFPQGTGSTDPGVPNNALNTLTYPAQGTASQTAGVQYNVNTAGYTNVSLTYDVRFSGTAANTYIVQYTPDVTNGFSPWIPLDTNVYTVDGSFINNQTINLAGVPAAQNNPNFGIRIVSAFAGSTNAYAPVNAAGYGTGGTVRYDMVTFTGNPVPYTVSWAPGGATTYSINPTTTGTYTVTVTETGVCSGTASVNVTVNPVATTVVNPVICADATYTLVDGTQVNTTGIYSRTTTSVVTGCDSIVVANLTVNPVYTTPVAATICSNEPYTLVDGTQVNSAGTYSRTVASALGCDSTVVVTLTVLPAQSIPVAASICANETYTLPNGTVVSTAGSYTNTFAAANGCDSTIITTLTVKPVFTSTQNPAICQGDSHTMPDGSTQNTAGTYTFPYTAANGCDSTITVNLTVNPVYTTNITVNICPGEDYTLVDGTVVDASGTYTAVTNSANGCDSTVIAVVTVRPNESTTVNTSICQGDTYTLVNGSSVTTAGTYVAATQSIYGCDSVVTVNLTLKPVYNQAVSETVCQGDTYTLPDGTEVSAGGVYTTQLSSVGGCDSTIVTTLTVSPLPNLNLGNDIVVQNPPVILNAGAGFATYDWNTGAQTQTITVTQNGTFSVTVTNGAGCEATDSISVNFTASIVNLGENGGSISLFPNPATDRFSVNVYGYTGGGSMQLDLINAVGQVVKTDRVANAAESFTKEMDIATLPSGSYTLRVKGTNAEANLRLIIAR